MIRRPPRSTLFPSPPLSRSVVIARQDAGDKHLVAYFVAQRPPADLPADLIDQLRALVRAACPEYMVPAHFVRLEDRKSTRLNSSHLVISYAVFCLKKKQSYL